MNKLKLLLAAAIIVFASSAQANVLYFYGHVQSVSKVNAFIRTGDAVYFQISYSPGNFVITEAFAFVNKSSLNLLRSTNTSARVIIDDNPIDQVVQWSAFGPGFNVDVATTTNFTSIPCIEGFDLGRSFQIFYEGVVANGVITATPRTKTGQ